MYLNHPVRSWVMWVEVRLGSVRIGTPFEAGSVVVIVDCVEVVNDTWSLFMERA